MNKNLRQSLIRRLRWTLISALCGVFAGASSTLFLFLLKWASETRQDHLLIIWALPLAGLGIGLIYHHFGKDVAAGNNLILDEIHEPKNVIPLRMAPLILLGTVITHLFGGSAGREGTAVQMGASLSDQLSHIFKVDALERKILLTAGAGAGFGAAIGAPWAGVVFGMEVIQAGKLTTFAWIECFIASFVGYYTAVALRAPHTIYPLVSIPEFSMTAAGYVLIAGILFGLAARAFIASTHVVEHLISKLIHYPPFKPLLGGTVVVLLFYIEGSYRYAGLGLPFIQEALGQNVSWHEPILKSIFTSLTVGSGFKGGEFIPLVFIGTTLGNVLSLLLPLSFGFLAALGFAAVFGGAANTPFACAIMAMEIFGYRIGVYALIACFVSYLFSGAKGIYKSQKPARNYFQKIKTKAMSGGKP